MGKRSDRLEEELDLTQGELRAEKQRSLELEDELIKAGLRPARDVPTSGPKTWRDRDYSRPAPAPAPAPLGIVRRGVDPDAEIACIQPDSTLDGGTSDAEEAIRQLRNAPAQVEREETTLEIVQRNNWERDQLNEKQRLANAIISRVASALGVTRWNDDGAEILEKAQRFSIFHHWMSRRLKALITEQPPIPAHDIVATAAHAARIAELRTVITALVAPAQLSKFLHERLVPTAVVPPSIFDTANAEAPVTGIATREDVLRLRDAFAVWSAERGVPVPDWLAATARSQEAAIILVDLLNLVLVPTLVRAGLVQR